MTVYYTPHYGHPPEVWSFTTVRFYMALQPIIMKLYIATLCNNGGSIGQSGGWVLSCHV